MQKHIPITNPLLNLADQYFSQAQIFSPKSASPLKAQAKLREKFHFFIESKAYSAILPQGNYESFLTARLVELEKLMPNGLQKNQFFEELTSILKNRVDGFLQHASAIERTGKQLKS